MNFTMVHNGYGSDNPLWEIVIAHDTGKDKYLMYAKNIDEARGLIATIIRAPKSAIVSIAKAKETK